MITITAMGDIGLSGDKGRDSGTRDNEPGSSGAIWPISQIATRQAVSLFAFQHFVDRDLATFVDRYYLVDRLESRKRDVHDVVARAQHELEW